MEEVGSWYEQELAMAGLLVVLVLALLVLWCNTVVHYTVLQSECYDYERCKCNSLYDAAARKHWIAVIIVIVVI